MQAAAEDDVAALSAERRAAAKLAMRTARGKVTAADIEAFGKAHAATASFSGGSHDHEGHGGGVVSVADLNRMRWCTICIYMPICFSFAEPFFEIIITVPCHFHRVADNFAITFKS